MIGLRSILPKRLKWNRIQKRAGLSVLFAIAFSLTTLSSTPLRALPQPGDAILLSSLDPYQFTPTSDSLATAVAPPQGFEVTSPLPATPATPAPPAMPDEALIAQATLPADVNPYEVAPPLNSPPPPPSVRPAGTPASTSVAPPPPPSVMPRVIKAPPSNPAGSTIKVTLPDPSIKPTDIPVPRPYFPPLPRQEVRGVWITTKDIEVLLDRNKLRKAIAQLASVNFNTVYPVVWNSGYALHPSAVARRVGSPQIYRGNQNQDPLKDIIDQGHRAGLSVMPWFEFGFMAPPTSEMVLNHPDWITQKRNGETTSVSAGGEVVWLNPLRPEVQRFITDLVMEVVNRYDIDGIQFDDHMSLPYEFGYDDYTRALYKKETGKNPPANAHDAAWTKWRADKITQFIGDLHDAVKTAKPKTVFSVSPNYQDFAYRFHLQDWLNWVRQGFVDEIVMQVYRDDFNSFVQVIERPEIREVKQKISTGIGILSGLPRRPISMRQIKQQSRAANQRGLGVAYFFYSSLWDDGPEPMGERQSGFRTLFPSPRSRLAQR